MSDDEGPGWVEGKKRPRPAPLSGSSVEVSRQSGLEVKTGTFGKSARFAKDKVVGHGHSSPYGHLFYHRNQLYKGYYEQEKSCTQGIGARPPPTKMLMGGPPPNVGPGSYPIIASAAKSNSALDGPEFCKTTLKIKLPSSLVPMNMPSPGPHARYEVRGDLNKGLPTFAKHKPLLSHGGRERSTEGDSDPGPGAYQSHTYKSVSTTASCPNLLGAGENCMEAQGGTKRCIKSTFGVANRFEKQKVPNSSPGGDRYYAHSKIWGPEEYLTGVRTCSFGACGKTDMANPLKGPVHDVSAVTYNPERGYSACLRTSALDGLTQRAVSPVNQFAKNLGSAKHATRQRSSPAGGGDAPGNGGGSPGGGAGGGDA